MERMQDFNPDEKQSRSELKFKLSELILNGLINIQYRTQVLKHKQAKEEEEEFLPDEHAFA